MCFVIEGMPNLMDGWGCCRCRAYNGLWRDVCKACLKEHCELPGLPSNALDDQADGVK